MSGRGVRAGPADDLGAQLGACRADGRGCARHVAAGGRGGCQRDPVTGGPRAGSRPISTPATTRGRIVRAAIARATSRGRHRGAEWCGPGAQPLGGLIRCPSHAWAYAAADGRLVSVGDATPTVDFKCEEHGLHPVAVGIRDGFVSENLAARPRALAPAPERGAPDNWPTADLVAGDRSERLLACNWTVFWENRNGCPHCPGIHPDLCEMVPI